MGTYEYAINLLDNGKKEEAIEYLKRTVEEFPETNGGKLAAIKLTELEGGDTDETSGDEEEPEEAEAEDSEAQ